MVLVKVNYQVAPDNGPLVFPVNRSLFQLFPGPNSVNSDTWNEIKKLHRTQELLRDRILYSPDYTAIMTPPSASKVDENTYELVDASDKSETSKTPVVISQIKPPEEEVKPTRVTSKKQPEGDIEKTVERKTAVSKFQSGISSPSS